MRTFIGALIGCFLCYACARPSPVAETANITKTDSLRVPSESVAQEIESKFPGAVPYQKGIDSLIGHLQQFGIPANTMLWGQSTCVDDITNTKNKLLPEIKGPFNFGGLAGLPFTGITGLDAFAHHVPEDGTAILFVGPHIGYDEKEGWGKILRHDQHHASSCCGALYAALSKLEKGELKSHVPPQEDYQEGVIEQFAYAHRVEIANAPEPLIFFTQLIYHEAFRHMSDYASKVRERHFRYAVVVGAIIINTDFNFTDYVWIDKVYILDVQKNQWVEGRRPTE